ncbi:cytochrome C biogenesis protein [filamentous cyanobacterium LEGE 11480]|uniref:Cytochrome C biogenesis protein n=1 Tax=Romeriopsis navalis LEGE 11480 TaxID=2777977 RepID=A0A928VN75_9CYAN|nr:cytochrome C biogenesis protein [Romeriopsis navalis]MBE9029786.1 cytochrome C biogenesis protein [Romeriopsis navalis LEGE 11480]
MVKFLRFLGSIKLAVPVLLTIAVILVWATFHESAVGSPTIQREVYKSVWFGALMFLLSVNLSASALLRYPWRGARKIGFALTHFGLVVLIAGSAAVIHVSTEGMMTVRIGGGANNMIRVEGDLLEVATADGAVQQAEVFIQPDGTPVPSQVGDLKILGYSPNTIKTVSFMAGGPVANPAVQLQFTSDRMGQTVDRWLAAAPAAYSAVEMGPAELEILQAKDDAQLEKLLQAPADNASQLLGTLKLTTPKGNQSIDVTQVSEQSVRAGDLDIRVLNTWNDFRINSEQQPVNGSDQPRNPAVQLAITQGEQTEEWFVFARDEFEPIRTTATESPIDLKLDYAFSPPVSVDGFRVIVGPDSQLFYAARSSKSFKSGAWTVGESVNPGWADFQIKLASFIPQATLQRQVVPVEAAGEDAFPALHVATADGADQWLSWGDPTEISTPVGEVFAAYSPRSLELPFAVNLSDFIVERNEGSESVAMWTSQLKLQSPDSNEVVERNVWMNNPTWFHGWKLAQASWNPGDLQQSTLQLKREPGWITALTWTGSVLVVGGIATMFYGGTVLKKLRRLIPTLPKSPTVNPAATAVAESAAAIVTDSSSELPVS